MLPEGNQQNMEMKPAGDAGVWPFSRERHMWVKRHKAK